MEAKRFKCSIHADGKAPGKVRIVADERTNRLLVRGDKALRDRVRAMIRNLDEAPEQSDEVVKVFRLKYANARQVAEVLRGVLADEKDKSSTTTSAGASSPSSGTTNLSSNGDSGSGRSQPGTTTITVGSSSLIADESQNALIVRASPRQIRQIETILVDLDSRRAQVLIQAAIVEVSGDNAAQLGVQWAGPVATLGDARADADTVVIDTPAGERSDMAITLAPFVDATVIVVAAESTSANEPLALRDEIEAAGGHIAGVVMNRSTWSPPGFLSRLTG